MSVGRDAFGCYVLNLGPLIILKGYNVRFELSDLLQSDGFDRLDFDSNHVHSTFFAGVRHVLVAIFVRIWLRLLLLAFFYGLILHRFFRLHWTIFVGKAEVVETLRNLIKVLLKCLDVYDVFTVS